MAKYNNVKYKGYDSIREYNRAQALKMLAKKGVISDLQEQIRYELIPTQYEHYKVQGARKMLDKKKLLERSVCYVADFQYMQNGELVVEDSKGMKTKEYIIKRKLMLYLHGIKIKEV
ncbi:DUF1064 domain-containing protein [Phocaeicola sp.]